MSRYVRHARGGKKDSALSYVNSVEGLVSLAQMGVLEIHAWGCHVADPKRSDLLVFDLDPAPEVPWSQIIDAAHIVRETLQRLHLRSYVRRTGGKGLHVVVPIAPHDFEVSFHFSHFVAVYLERRHPTLFTSSIKKDLRTNKIFVDYLRNRFSSSAVANYSTRARPGAPVAWPMHWQQLEARTLAQPFGVRDALALLQHQPAWQDPWESMRHVSQALTEEICTLTQQWQP